MKFRVSFCATVSREVEVPDGLVWHEAYDFVRDQLGWHDIAHSAAASIEIDTRAVLEFRLVKGDDDGLVA